MTVIDKFGERQACDRCHRVRVKIRRGAVCETCRRAALRVVRDFERWVIAYQSQRRSA
jgi:hypothetical protein